METKLPPASTPTSPSSPGLSPVPPPDKVDGFSRRSLRRARPRRSHSSSQFRYQSNQQELTPLPLLKGEPWPSADACPPPPGVGGNGGGVTRGSRPGQGWGPQHRFLGAGARPDSFMTLQPAPPAKLGSPRKTLL